MEVQPMKDSEYGRYVCVAHGGCLHTRQRGGRDITSDGVWVKHGTQFSSAHRDCYERWVTDEQPAPEPAMYAVMVDGMAWEDADGRTEWTRSEAYGVAESCESKGYDNVAVVES